MNTTRITKNDLDILLREADAVSTLETNFGEYGAIVWIDDKVFDVYTRPLDPTSGAKVRTINDAEAQRLMQTDFRTVRRF